MNTGKWFVDTETEANWQQLSSKRLLKPSRLLVVTS
jgi:hypothetical protein